jgi:poly(3-hydroxybutyrate) depolymerase
MLACGLLVACGGGAPSNTGQGGGGQAGSGASGSGGATGGGGATATAGSGGSVGSAGTGGSASGSAGSGGGVTGAAGAAAGTSGATGGAGRGGSSAGGAAGTSAAGAGGSAGSATGSGGRGGGSAGGGTGTAGAGGGAMPSAGCGMANPPASGRYTIDVSGTAREYIIKMPAGYDNRRAYRLIFAFHGAMYDAASVDAGGAPSPSGPYYGIEPLAGGNAIFVAGQALSGGWTNTSGRDVAYVNAMITRLESQLCIDQSRIFATGFSFGAIMTIALGCAEADQFRAIAPMSGRIQGTCGGNAAIAYWASHGTDDTTIPPADGMAARDEFRMRNGCTTQTMPGDRAGCVDYQGCSAGHPLTWCSFTGAHMPPPFSGEAIWAFFSRF